MNRGHRQLCASARWGRHIRDDLVPWVIGDRPLGGSVLEIGPGPGLTTDVLRSRTRRLTAVEADARAARSLQRRMTGANVTVVHADAVAMPFRSGRFTAGVAMTMLHHVPTVAAQDALAGRDPPGPPSRSLAAGRRLDRQPGVPGVPQGRRLRAHRPGDVRCPALRAGFVDVEVEPGDGAVRFAGRSRRPTQPSRKEPDMVLPYEEPLTPRTPAERVIPEPPRRGEPGGEPCGICAGESTPPVWSERPVDAPSAGRRQPAGHGLAGQSGARRLVHGSAVGRRGGLRRGGRPDRTRHPEPRRCRPRPPLSVGRRRGAFPRVVRAPTARHGRGTGRDAAPLGRGAAERAGRGAGRPRRAGWRPPWARRRIPALRGT